MSNTQMNRADFFKGSVLATAGIAGLAGMGSAAMAAEDSASKDGSITLEDLAARVQYLEDVRACEQLMYQYEWYLDHGYDGEGIASLFTEDGLWEIEGVGGTAQGYDAIVQHAADLVAGLPWGQHNMVAPMITIDPDGTTATGTFCLIATLTLTEDDGEDAAYIEIGKYRNEYVKVDGEWKFQHLYGNMEKAGRWELGWVADSLVKEF